MSVSKCSYSNFTHHNIITNLRRKKCLKIIIVHMDIILIRHTLFNLYKPSPRKQTHYKVRKNLKERFLNKSHINSSKVKKLQF